MIRVLCVCGVWAVAARAAVIAGVRKILVKQTDRQSAGISSAGQSRRKRVA